VADDTTGTSISPPEPEIVLRRRFPLVWLIPIAASLIGIAMLVQSWRSGGPRVWIEFANAQGLTAGKTHVSYKDVVVGTVSAVSLSKDRSGVVATVEFTRDARDLLKDEPAPVPISAVRPAGRRMAGKVSVFIEFLAELRAELSEK
jgi:paraquat-inducible protein B